MNEQPCPAGSRITTAGSRFTAENARLPPLRRSPSQREAAIARGEVTPAYVAELRAGCGAHGIGLLRGIRAGSVLASVDVEPEYQRLARAAFVAAGFAAGRYRLISGRALDVLPRLADGAYDLVFCDADRQEYPDYLDRKSVVYG